MTKEKRGLQIAIEFLQVNYPLSFVPDDLHQAAGLNIKVDTLAHSLRRARSEGKVIVIYEKGLTSIEVAKYRFNPAYGKADPVVSESPKVNTQEVDTENVQALGPLEQESLF